MSWTNRPCAQCMGFIYEFELLHQAEAERRKRAQILESEGDRQSKINVAEGDKAQVILSSEAAKQDAINRATGTLWPPCTLFCHFMLCDQAMVLCWLLFSSVMEYVASPTVRHAHP